jgi:hypothetical protein
MTSLEGSPQKFRVGWLIQANELIHDYDELRKHVADGNRADLRFMMRYICDTKASLSVLWPGPLEPDVDFIVEHVIRLKCKTVAWFLERGSSIKQARTTCMKTLNSLRTSKGFITTLCVIEDFEARKRKWFAATLTILGFKRRRQPFPPDMLFLLAKHVWPTRRQSVWRINVDANATKKQRV